jgi:DNA-binding IscR family transcriptional regulator
MLPAYRLAEGRRVPGRELAEALAVLASLARAQSEGRVLPLRRLSKQIRVVPHRCESVLERARDLGWTARTERDGWLLTRDADTVTLSEIYRAYVLDADSAGVGEIDLGLSLRQYSQKDRRK